MIFLSGSRSFRVNSTQSFDIEHFTALAHLQYVEEAEHVLLGITKYLGIMGISGQCSRAIRHTIKSAFQLEPWSLARKYNGDILH